MSPTDVPLDDPAERSAAAGEYVLGTLAEAEHDAFERGLPRDAERRAQVYAWQDRLLPLTRHAPAVQPSSTLWPRIEATIERASPPMRPRRAVAAPWWQRPGPWRGLSGVAVAASLVLAILLVRREPPVPAGARYVAVLQSPDQRTTGWLVEVRAGDVLRLVPMAAGPTVPPDRALQFWTKPQNAAAPTSLGLVRAGAPVELPVSRLPAVGEAQLFEITLEPATGSPTGRPTGPILFVGRTVRL